VHLTALALTPKIRLEVLSQTGESVYDSGFRPGNRLEWSPKDQQGLGLPDGIYGCIVTVEDLSGRLGHRRGVFRIADGGVSFDTVNLQPEAAAPEEQESLTILGAEEPSPFTIVSHDGQEGWIESASGGLSFYAGSLSHGRDAVPHLRLTHEGNLGIGVADPQAKLDVAGLIRASGGFQFADGTVLKIEGGLPILVSERSNGTDSASGTEGKMARPLSWGGGIGVVPAGSGGPGRVFGSEGGEPYYNTLYGYSAGTSNTSAYYNSFFGGYAGHSNTTGDENSLFGHYAGSSNTSGSGNSFFGYLTGAWNTTGCYNSFFGDWVGGFNSTGGYNSFFGAHAGFNNTTGQYNSFVGSAAGASNTVEHNNTFIGALSEGYAGITNATTLGYRAKVTQSNSVVLGSMNGVNDATADTNVGIGTTAPVGRFHVATGPENNLFVGSNSRVGIGTVTPDKSLQIVSTSAGYATIHIGSLGDEAKDVYSGMGPNVDTGPAFNFGYSGSSFGRSSGFFNVRPDPSAIAPNPSLRFMTVNQQRMIITNTGNVGIGTSSPTERLHVVGNIRATGSIYSSPAPEIEIPDYVFEPDYRLMPIQQLEKYIAREKHLPNVPAASEIRETGLNHTEFQMKLLEKIEELTIYTVQQAKTIRELQARLAALENER
jgi:hypothetical protein